MIFPFPSSILFQRKAPALRHQQSSTKNRKGDWWGQPFWLLFSLFSIFLLFGTGEWRRPSLFFSSLGAQDQDDETVGNPQVKTSPPGLITLTPEEQKTTPIKVAWVSRLRLDKTITTMGEIQLNTHRLIYVVPFVSGTVERLYKVEGEAVQKGDPLAILSSPALGEAKVHYLQARLASEIARQNYAREKTLFQNDKMTTQQAYLEAKQALQQAQADLDIATRQLQFFGLSAEEITHIPQEKGPEMLLYTLRSSLTGTLLERNIVQGEFVQAFSTPAFWIADLSHVWAIADVYEKDIADIRLGEKARLTVPSYPGHSFEGTVVYIPSQLDEKSRTLEVRLDVNNSEGLLKANMSVQVRLTKSGRGKVLAVPQEALQTLNQQSVVFIQEKPGVYRTQRVRTGSSNETDAEILQGLSEGQKVAVSNTFLLKSEAEKETLEAIGEN